MKQNQEYNQAPYMGQITANRISGGGGINLYGSGIQHHEVVAITITGSKSYSSFNKDRFVNTDNKIEVWLSPGQWAELLTRMNAGCGTPCTIRYEKGAGYMPVSDIPDPPPIHYGNYHEEVINDTRNDIKEIIDKITALANKGKAGKKELDELARSAGCIAKNLEPNFKHIIKCAEERCEGFVTQAKQEIAAIIESAGLRHVHSQIEASKLKELE